MFRRLSAWRHGHGFGVHSPLGYTLVKSVLPDKPAYYADADINRMFASARRRRVARIILRLVCHFHPATVNCPPQLHNVIAKADSRAILTDNSTADMTVSQDDGRTVITIIADNATAGNGPLVLDNLTDLTIVIYRRGLSAQTINTRL